MVAILAVLLPLGRRGELRAGGSEANVYKDQLSEIDRDVTGGTIGVAEAEAARVEIGRRLLASVDGQRDPPVRSHVGLRRATAIFALLGLPVVAIAFYLPLGSPQLADAPLAERGKVADPTQPLVNLVAQVEAHLEKNPTDGRGWNVLAPVLARLGRYDDAIRAYRNSIAYSGDSAERRSNLGEAMVGAGGGVVTTEAKAEFDRALAMRAEDPKANYFLGLAAEQDGRNADAITIWRALLDSAPADAPWRPLIQEALARVGGPAASALPDNAVAAARDPNEAEQSAMIRGMVDRLATRLKQDGSDIEGWLRLVRAYMVMGERDKAVSALTAARQAVSKDAGRLRQLNEGLKDMGLDG